MHGSHSCPLFCGEGIKQCPVELDPQRLRYKFRYYANLVWLIDIICLYTLRAFGRVHPDRKIDLVGKLLNGSILELVVDDLDVVIFLCQVKLHQPVSQCGHTGKCETVVKITVVGQDIALQLLQYVMRFFSNRYHGQISPACLFTVLLRHYASCLPDHIGIKCPAQALVGGHNHQQYLAVACLSFGINIFDLGITEGSAQTGLYLV